MRALQDEAQAVAPNKRPPTDTTSPTLFMGIGVTSESTTLSDRQRTTRFRRASSATRSNPAVVLLTRLFSSLSSRKKDAADTKKDADAAQAAKNAPTPLMKAAAPLEKASALISRLPNPLIMFLTVVLLILLTARLRPHWLRHIAVRVSTTLALLVTWIMSALWNKTQLFCMIRERREILTHPTEHRLDPMEAELLAREQGVKTAEEELRDNRDRLDTLRKELLKEGNTISADGKIMPSRAAAEMIAAGALGAGFDAATAAEVEQRRKEENVRRLREEWHARASQSDDDREEMQKNLRMLADHAATAYEKRTRELKTRTTAAAGSRADKLSNLKNFMQNAALRSADAEAARVSRHSERSVFGSAAGMSVVSGKRLTLLSRRKRRTAPELDDRMTMSESGGRGVSQSDV